MLQNIAPTKASFGKVTAHYYRDIITAYPHQPSGFSRAFAYYTCRDVKGTKTTENVCVGDYCDAAIAFYPLCAECGDFFCPGCCEE